MWKTLKTTQSVPFSKLQHMPRGIFPMKTDSVSLKEPLQESDLHMPDWKLILHLI